MNVLKIKFNGKEYLATYNKETGYYEIEVRAPAAGGEHETNITFSDIFESEFNKDVNIPILAPKKIDVQINKIFMWIFDYRNFSTKDVVELSNNYEVEIDEETNATSIVRVLKKTKANSEDLVCIKKNGIIIYWGKICEIHKENNEDVYQYSLKYITNIFDEKIELKNEEIIKTIGVEDFNATTIKENYIENEDAFLNKNYLMIETKTHTKRNVSVSNVENRIYNLHTWLTNCTQNYNIIYEIHIKRINNRNMLVFSIENKEYQKELINLKGESISNYSEVFETGIVSKVIVLTDTDNYYLYLLNNRTTTIDPNHPDRFLGGKVETIFVQNYEDARQSALNIIKANSYNHKITFELYKKYMKVGTPIAIKTKDSTILETYVSAIRITNSDFFEYTCGNVRTKFIDKLLKLKEKI